MNPEWMAAQSKAGQRVGADVWQGLGGKQSSTVAAQDQEGADTEQSGRDRAGGKWSGIGYGLEIDEKLLTVEKLMADPLGSKDNSSDDQIIYGFMGLANL